MLNFMENSPGGLIFKVALFLIVLKVVSAKIYYVKSSLNGSCPEKESTPCLTLSQYAIKPSDFFVFITTLILLPGNHRLSVDFSVQNITIFSMESDSYYHTSVYCDPLARFIFEHIEIFNMRGLALFGCMNNEVSRVSDFTMDDCSFVGQEQNGTGLELTEVSNAIINRSSFISHTGREIVAQDQYAMRTSHAGGAIIVKHSSCSISNSILSNNKVVTELNGAGGALYAVSCPMIAIVNCTLNNNSVIADNDSFGGAVSVVFSQVIVINSTLNNNIVIAQYQHGEGGAIYARRCSFILIHSMVNNNSVSGQYITYGAGGAVSIQSGSTLYTSINSSELNHNTVSGQYGTTSADGAVSLQSCFLAINSSELNHNTVSGQYGTTSAGGAVSLQSCFLAIDSSELNHNTVSGQFGTGGAVYVLSGNTAVTINHSTLNHNTVSGQYGVGGAVVVQSINSNELNHNAVTSQNGSVGAVSSFTAIISSELNHNAVTSQNGDGGAVYFQSLTSFTAIISSKLNHNAVTTSQSHGIGGAVVVWLSFSTTICSSELNHNTVNVMNQNGSGLGGAVYVVSSISTTINCSKLNHNTIHTMGQNGGGGGAIFTKSSFHFVLYNVTLYKNTLIGYNSGGGAFSAMSTRHIEIVDCKYNSNSVTGTQDQASGGAVYVDLIDTLIIVNSRFEKNIVTGDAGVGGAIIASSSPIVMSNCTFRNNSVSGQSSVIHLINCFVQSTEYLTLCDNVASSGLLYAIESILYLHDNVTVSNNRGSLLFYSSNVTFSGHTNIMNNTNLNSSSQEGSTVAAIQSEIFFMGRANLMYNKAVQGGAISATQSKVHVYGNVTISQNIASESGGGIYAYQSELNFVKSDTICGNTARTRGGGIHVISSIIKISNGSHTSFIGNHAKRGGGICLEGSAKIYSLKPTLTECLRHESIVGSCNLLKSSWTTLHLSNNSADYGGAVYIDDNTNSAVCHATPFNNKTTASNECFIQSLAQYRLEGKVVFLILSDFNTVNTYFMNNFARVVGNAIYGGLLDRCGVSTFAELFQVKRTFNQSSLSAIDYITNITDLGIQDFNSTRMISSDAVRVCFCKDNQPDCSYHPQPIHVRKGETFSVSLVAVDHINNTIANSTIHAYVSTEGKLGEGQSVQLTNYESCTDLSYSILSPNNSEKIHIYADGPCMNAGISKSSLTVIFEACPIGFKEINLHCKCDPILYPEYASNCSIDKETVLRKDNAWFAYVNTTDHNGYILHKFCPFDYCHPPTKHVSVNLRINDELCAYNRSGKLCGSCQDGLSLSLGSSLCRPCSNSWLALLIGFAIAGIVLVAFLLKLNLTVAVGTINGLIFFANVFAANRTIFFPHDETKLFTVFIAWLNLDFGFETCFYDGMDGYVKTWLQFAFPLYVISLVAAIIIISERSTKFAMIFTVGKYPIQTLATLILLSYTKFLRTIIASLSFTTLQYSDGSSELVWLIDANIPYLSGKHIPLFITAVVVGLVGFIYTFILFAWQWLVHCPNRGPLKWIIGNTKVIAFIDAYHNPYNKDHRYWIGLLLLVCVVLYLVSAVNVLGNPRINLFSIIITTAVLLVFQRTIEKKSKIYKRRFIELIETVSVLNLAGLTIITFFITENEESQNWVTYTSIGIAFVTFLTILMYHMHRFILGCLLQKICDKFYTGRISSQRQALTMTPPDLNVVIPNEELVSVTEFDGLPEPVDTCHDESIVTDDCDGVQDLVCGNNPVQVDVEANKNTIEAANCDRKPTSNEVKGTVQHKIERKVISSSVPLPNSLLLCQPLLHHTNASPVEIELPSLSSGCDIFQPPMMVESKLEDDDNESAPLLLHD